MSKYAYLFPRFEVYDADADHWVDASDDICSHTRSVVHGDLAEFELEVILERGAHIIREGHVPGRARVAMNDTIILCGVDVSSWCSGYDIIARVGDLDRVRLHLQDDPEKFRLTFR